MRAPFIRRQALGALALTPLLFLLGPPVATGQTASLQPPGWDAGVKLPEAPDLNPDPRILEINLEASVAAIEIRPTSICTRGSSLRSSRR